MNSGRRRKQDWWLVLPIICFPWVNPFVPGPAVSLIAWLVSAFCFGAYLLVDQLFAADGDEPNYPLPVTVAMSWLIAASISSVLGLLQYLGLSESIAPWAIVTMPGEAFANLRQRNQFASLTSIGLLALMYLCRTSRDWVGLSVYGAIAAATLLGVGNATSSSRTGLLQLAVLVAISVMWGAWRVPVMRRIWVSALLAYVLATLLLPWAIGFAMGDSGILGRFNEVASTCQSRRVLWSNVLALIAQKPWFGWGWGELDFAHFITLYGGGADARFCDILDNAHNLPLHLAVELGVPFSTLVCTVLAGLIAWLRPWDDHNPARQMAWGVLLVIGLHSLLEYPLWYGPFQIATGLCVLILWQTHPLGGIAGAYIPAQKQAHTELDGPRFALLNAITPETPSGAFEQSVLKKKNAIVDIKIASLAIFLIAFCSYAIWDYHRISQIYLAPSERSEAYRDNTMEKIRGSWLFKNHVKFAALTTTAVTPANAAFVHEQALRLLHFSPEVRVVEKLIDSALLLGLEDEATFFKRRFQLAFPEAFGQWQARQIRP